MAEWDDDERNTKVLFRWDRPPSPELSLGDILRDLHTADKEYDDQHDPMPYNEEELCEDHEYEEEEICEYDQHNLMPNNEDDDGDDPVPCNDDERNVHIDDGVHNKYWYT
jgi:hypothetical protein